MVAAAAGLAGAGEGQSGEESQAEKQPGGPQNLDHHWISPRSDANEIKNSKACAMRRIGCKLPVGLNSRSCSFLRWGAQLVTGRVRNRQLRGIGG